MPRILRIGLRIAAGLLALLMILVIAGVLVIRSEWFRQKVQNRVVQEAARITGGQVEMDRFEFDWSTLTARVEGFVLRCSERWPRALSALAVGTPDFERGFHQKPPEQQEHQ